ncbi:response regulator [Zhaonella formicivorans]|uniref:response regulator n=1 Tax=Zhaonella formicivorans TaxID=2528593 RepID=UPI0010D6EDE2|nr:response regulator [Zhaonella formicivorans]
MQNPHHILVVDDQRGVRQLLETFFKEEGFRTTTAGNGKEAVDLIERENPDLIIMDVKMPVMGGSEALARIKKLKPVIPVLMMTAYADEEKQKELLMLGAIECFLKPLDLEQLLEKVYQVLQ